VYLLNLPQVPVISTLSNARMILHNQMRIQDLAIPLIVWFAVQGAPPLLFDKQGVPITPP
jgi:hypothetical protein